MRFRAPSRWLAAAFILAGILTGAFLGFKTTLSYRAAAWAKFERVDSSDESAAILPALGRSAAARDYLRNPRFVETAAEVLPPSSHRVSFDVVSYPGPAGPHDPCFEIAAESVDQNLAVRAANVYTETAVRLWNEQESEKEESTLRQLEEKTALMRQNLTKIGEEIAAYRAQTPEVVFLNAPENLRENQKRLERDLRAKDDGIAGCESRKGRLESELDRLKSQSQDGLDPNLNDPILRPLRTEIAAMNSQYSEMSARYTEKNPKMIRFRERLDEKRKELDGKTKELRDRNVVEWNGRIEPKNAEIKATDEELAGLKSDRERIQSEIEEESKRVRKVESGLPVVRVRLNELEEKEKQSKAELEAVGKVLAEKKAELASAPSPQSLVVYQRATAAKRVTSYGGLAGGVGGAAAGYLLALVLSLLQVNLRRSFIDTKDVETELGHPVLARFPKRG